MFPRTHWADSGDQKGRAMRRIIPIMGGLALILSGTALGQGGLPTDVFETAFGELRITFVGHGSLFFTFQGKVIHVDPVSQYGDYTAMPKADLILITHEHRDHLDEKAIGSISKKETVIVGSSAVAEVFRGAISMANGDVKEFLGLKVEAVPAYNLVHMRSLGSLTIPRGEEMAMS